MKKTRRTLSLALACMLVLTLLCACGQNSSSRPSSTPAPTDISAPDSTGNNASDGGDEVYTIDMVSTFPAGNVNYEVCKILCEKVSEVTDGRLEFNLLGGSEIFAGSAGAEAVMNGALDAVYTAADYICGFVPEAAAICATNMNSGEMIASGGVEYLNNILANSGIHLLFVVDEVGISGTKIFTKNEISSLSDLAGMNIRTAGTVQVDIISSLGCTATPLGLADVFPGLEQGLIDGYVGPAYLGRGEGYFEYVKCVIDTEIARGGSSLYVNAEVWQSVPEDLRIMFESGIGEINSAMVELYEEYVENNEKAIAEAGGKVAVLSDEDRETLLQANADYSWKSVENMVDEETYKTLRELFTK